MTNFLEKLKNLDFYKDLTLEKKIMLAFSGSLAVFFMVFGYILISGVTENNIHNAQTSTVRELQIRDLAFLSIERSLKGKVKLLAKDAALTGEWEDASRVLRRFIKDNEEFSQVLFGRNDGEFVEIPRVSRENSFDPRNTIWYKDAVAAGSNDMMIVTAPFQGLDSKAKVGFYAAADYHGVVGGAVDFAALVKMSGDAENLIILDNNDDIVFDDKNSQNLFNKLNKANMGDLSLVGQKNEGVSKVSLESVNMLAVVYKSEITKLKYIKLIDYNEAVKSANNAKRIILIAFVVMFALSIVLSKLLYKDIKKSFTNIEAQTEAIGEGKLDDIAAVEESSDEVGRLSFAFGKMAGSVKSRLMTMETESQNLRALIKDMSEKIEAAKVTLESIFTNSDTAEAAKESEEKSLLTLSGEIKTLLKDFEEIEDLKSKCKTDIMALVQDLNKTLEGVSKLYDENAENIRRQRAEAESAFKEDVATLNKALEKTADNASEISLMAFSAALEAARDKDKKSKFAQIAEDIRKLADEMANAAAGERKNLEKLAPKILEIKQTDLQKEFSGIMDKAKAAETALNSMETAVGRLEAAGKTIEAAAKEAGLSQDVSKTAQAEIARAVKDAAKLVEETEKIADKAFDK